MIASGVFVIAGDWDQSPTPPGKLRIVMPPLGVVRGAGWEDFTQAGLRAVSEYIKPGMTFAEIGAGSGILSVAASLVGARKCYATELNKDALKAAKRVFAANDVNVELIDGTYPPERVDLAIICTGSESAKDIRPKVDAKAIVVIEDNAHLKMWA